ncbi:MAG: alpha-1,2-fucosyltransferase [Cohaesibacteraceae bacterium]|nr:alpha-1,2-fucosyltransferase [Cohaesibacteraceae bacterium]MBL4876524.1 alpha-1,2-fucosyltransferase [Cohaesibacteraceae bacterium]
MNKIVLRLCGGLGNQMFQYSLGRHLSLRHKLPLLLDTHLLETDNLRSYALGNYKLNAQLATTKELKAILPWPTRLPSKLAWLPRWPGSMAYIRETKFDFDPSIFQRSGSMCLEGYWQSEKYFLEIEKQIRLDFELTQPISSNRQTVLEEIINTNSISVHVRRGDYVTNPVTNAFHGTCSPEWYANSMNRMGALTTIPTYFIFSDDPEWAEKELPKDRNIRYVVPQNDHRDYEDMHLMSKCKHNIIANSSFSWWGAWLNTNSKKRVFAPTRWFTNNSNNTRDLLPEDWIKT